MAALADEAEALAWGVCSGIVGVDDVVTWADAKVLSTDTPHPILCDVATSGRAHPFDLASLLRAIPGQPDSGTVHDLRVRLMLRTLNEGEQFARVVAEAIDGAYLGKWYAGVGLGVDGDSVRDTLDNADAPMPSGTESVDAASTSSGGRAVVIAGMKELLRRHIEECQSPLFDGLPDI